jgi:carbon starvation protein CstA
MLPALSPVAIGTQGPPPPITADVLHLFLDLAASYEAVGSNIPVSFGEWIVMNGITDLRTQWCLMWRWWSVANQSAVD